jgi:hypothetical protein
MIKQVFERYRKAESNEILVLNPIPMKILPVKPIIDFGQA